MLVGRLDDGRRNPLEERQRLVQIGNCGDHHVVLLSVHAPVVHTQVALDGECRPEYEYVPDFLFTASP